MNQNQNTEVNATSTIEAQAASQAIPVKELIPATAATAQAEEPLKKSSKKDKKAKKAAKAAKEAEAAQATETKTSKKDKKAKEETPAEAKADKKKKKKSAKDKAVAETAEQQKPSIMEEVISHRDVKYIYPEDVVDTLSRKTWRQKTRNKLRALERDMLRITDQNSKEYKKAKKKYEEFRDSVLKPAQAV